MPAPMRRSPGGFATGKAVQVSDKELWCLATADLFRGPRRKLSRPGGGGAGGAQPRQGSPLSQDHLRRGVPEPGRRNSCQFSFACDGIPETINDRKSWAQAEDIADKFTKGELYLTEVADATHYHATYVRPAWAPRMQKVTQIGLHVFYKFKRGWLFG